MSEDTTVPITEYVVPIIEAQCLSHLPVPVNFNKSSRASRNWNLSRFVRDVSIAFNYSSINTYAHVLDTNKYLFASTIKVRVFVIEFDAR